MASPSTSELCRTCLKPYDNIDLYAIFNEKGAPNQTLISNSHLAEFFFQKIQISNSDEFPQNICVECYDLAMMVAKFFDDCEKSHQILRECDVKEEMTPPPSKRLKLEFVDPIKTEADVDLDLIAESNCVDFNILEDIIEEVVDEQEEVASIERTDDAIGEIFEVEEYTEFEALDDALQDCIAETVKHVDVSESFEKEILKEVSSQKIPSNPTEASKQNGVESRESELNAIKEAIESSRTKGDIKCQHCCETFTSEADKKKHWLTFHSGKRPYMCSICRKTFATIVLHNTHIKLHYKEGVQCNLCKEMFKDKKHLFRHQKAIHINENLTCSQCSQTFKVKKIYDYHLKTHEEKKKFQCSYCPKSFLQSHHLADHERIHTGEKPYLCNTCGKSFRTDGSLKNHILVHGDDIRKKVRQKTYSCDICPRTFFQYKSIVLHKRKHANNKPFSCETCGASFFLKSYLTSHIMRAHTQRKPLTCEVCGDGFCQTSSLKWHMQTVHDAPMVIQMHTCKICNRSFKNGSSLTNHMRVHIQTEERTHVCPICGDAFLREKHLQSHTDIMHLDKKKHACDQCSKRFYYPGQLKEHYRHHTGEKPYSCPHCDKTFRLSKVFQNHLRIHTGEKPFKCKYCEQAYRTRPELNAHENLLHSAQIRIQNENLVENITEIKTVESL